MALRTFLAVGLLAGLACAQSQSTSGFDLSQLDRTADPCVDFYQYSCGGWSAKNPLPADQARYNRYVEMNESNLKKLRQVLEDGAKPGAKDPVEKQVGEYYAACVDETAAETKKAQPLQPYFKRIDSAHDKKELLMLMAELNERGVPMLFTFGSTPDPHNALSVIAEVDQSGLSLPDRDYYLKTDNKSVEQRQKFVEHVAKMLSLTGEGAPQAQADAEFILKFETELAKASLDRTARRDPHSVDHKMALAQFTALAPELDFKDYLKPLNAPAFDALNVATPDFFKQASALVQSTPLPQLKTYVRWKLIRRMARTLSADFVNEDFHFNGQYMSGTKQLEPRWKRCVRAVDNQLGEASGKLFVEHYFGSEGKQKVQEIVRNVMDQLEASIRAADWMSDVTKQKALVKLKAINTSKLGFPDKYRDYTSITIKRDDFAGNVMRAAQFESHRQRNKIGKPVDRTEWAMTPPTVNAYYEPQLSEIVLPAGILQPPMFDLKADDAYSYGAIGRVIGHELTHGFDDEGRQFDEKGNLTDWWTKEDATAFDQRASCVAKQYSGFSPVDDGNGKPLYLNGKLTLGENVADNGGLRMAYAAYMKAHADEPEKTIDGFTPAQRVFLGYAISRCENVSPEMSRMLVVTDPHSPGKFRLIGPIQNMPEFANAFACKAGQPMAPENRCKVW